MDVKIVEINDNSFQIYIDERAVGEPQSELDLEKQLADLKTCQKYAMPPEQLVKGCSND